jgi:ketosteroid isomerase-like protein
MRTFLETDRGVPDAHRRVRCVDTTPASDIASFLDRYAEALAAGDLPGIAACYALPALVVGDAGTIPVSEAAQVEAAFAGDARQRTSYRYLLRRSDADRLGIQVVVDTTPQP